MEAGRCGVGPGPVGAIIVALIYDRVGRFGGEWAGDFRSLKRLCLLLGSIVEEVLVAGPSQVSLFLELFPAFPPKTVRVPLVSRRLWLLRLLLLGVVLLLLMVYYLMLLLLMMVRSGWVERRCWTVKILLRLQV